MDHSLEEFRQKIIRNYSDKAKIRFAEYEASSTAHCRQFQHHMTKPPARILDIGSGSGRDAAYYTGQGYQVTAVEPATELRALAQQKYGTLEIEWVEDVLPELSIVKSRFQPFDHIHMTAVIFHLPKDYTRAVLQTAFDLLKENSTLYVSIRNGPTDPERPMFDVTKEHVMAEAKGLFGVVDQVTQPSSSRADISWDCLIFRKL